MQNFVANRRALSTVITGMILLVATAVLGSAVVTWSNGGFSTSKAISSALYSTNVNALNEKLVIENVGFGNATSGGSNISYDSSNKAKSGSSSVSFPLTVANNPNRMLIVTAAAESGPGGANDASTTCHAATVTYSGQSLTRASGYDLDDSGADQCTSLWYLKNPPSGTANVVITTSASVSENNGGAISLYNVAQQGPESTAFNFIPQIQNPSSITTAINTITNHAWVIDSVGSGNQGLFTAGSGQISRYTTPGTTSANSASTKDVAVAGSTIMQESQAANRLVHVLAAFAPASSFSKFLNIAMYNVGPVGITVNEIKVTNSTGTQTVWTGTENILSQNSLNQNITYNWGTNIPVSIKISSTRGSVFTTDVSP